jgi:3'-phosphoadenosine 5'-phosphosulfate sulfotransferase (PAPS reductase)/FAD synthetase
VSRVDLFTAPTALDAVATDPIVDAAIANGAVFAFSLSGGKDSGALAFAAMRHLDQMGHPRERRIAIHADLGRVEWKSTPAMVEATAARLGLPLHIVRRKAGDLLARWQVRFFNAKVRYEDLATYNLIGPWSQANKRFCTSELKAQVIGPYLAQLFKGQTIVQVVGIRREESTGRKAAPVSKPDTRFAQPGNRAGTSMMLWHPGVEWTKEEIFSCHTRHAIPLHEAYTTYGSSRLSCAFCVLGSIGDLRAASNAAGNVDLYRELVAMEADSTFSFQPERWLADVAPSLLSPGLVADVAKAKVDAVRRNDLEASMPGELRYTAGWPPRAPDFIEARAIVNARRAILHRHSLEDRYPTPAAVQGRFNDLLAAKAVKAAASDAAVRAA